MFDFEDVLSGRNNIVQQMISQSIGKLVKDSIESNLVESTKEYINVDVLNKSNENIYVTRDMYRMFLIKLIFNKKYKFIKRVHDPVEDTWFLTSPSNGLYYVMLDKKNVAILILSTFKTSQGDIDDDKKVATIQIIGPECHDWIVYFKRKRNDLWEKFDPRKGKVWIRPINSGYTSINAKNFENIILDESKKKDIINTIDKFLANKDFYKDNGIPYKFGMLLYGPPGTGKSSIIHSIASKYNKNITILTSENIYEHMTRNNLSSKTLSRDILLIEEIDSLMSNDPLTIDSEDKKSSKTGVLRREQILKFIDGLPNNCILIATTNFYEKLDEAMIRPGRFDLKVEMNYFDKEQTIDMIKSYDMNESFADRYDGQYPICPAQLQADIVSAKCEALYKEK